MCVLFVAGKLWSRKRRVKKRTDCHPNEVRCGGDVPINGRASHVTEVVRSPPVIASLLVFVGGKIPLRRFPFNLQLLTGKPPLNTERRARAQLARVAVAQRNPVRVGAFIGNAELSAAA